MNTLTKLNLNNNPATFLNGDIKYAKNIVATQDQKAIHNEDGFNLIATYPETIIGRVEIPNGYVLFLKDDTDRIICINNGITKTISSIYFNFNIDHPIKGRFTFNSSNDLYITFSEGVNSPNETRIINIDKSCIGSSVTLSQDDVKQLDLISNLIYPSMEFEVVTTGSLLVGTYQIAIAYQVEKGIYTNYSILSVPVYVFGNLTDHNKIGTSITRAIKVTFDNIDTSYTKFKLGILYKGEDAFESCHETDDILTSVASYNISNLDSLSSTSIDALTIGSISYIKDEDHVSFNGRLIRTNVQTPDYTGIDDVMNNIASKVAISLFNYTPDNGFNNSVINQDKHFKAGEQYILYIGCIDYKGNFVNAYSIPWKDGDETEIAYTNSSETVSIHKMPYREDSETLYKSVSRIECTLPSNIDTLLGVFVNTITSFCYFYAEHNLNNSKVIGQGFAIRDTGMNDFNGGQHYYDQFRSTSKLRFYSFEHLFNKSLISNVSLYNSRKLYGFSRAENYINNYKYRRLFTTEESILKDKELANVSTVAYIDNDNTVSDNIAGDSFHRLTMTSDNINKILGGAADKQSVYNESTDTWTVSPISPAWELMGNVDDSVGDYPNYNLMALSDLISNSDYLYDDIYKQRLVIASNIIPKSKTIVTTLTGDFFYNNLTIRLTTPGWDYVYGGSDITLGGEDHVVKVILSFDIESRSNIKARYSGVNDYQKVFNLQTMSDVVTDPIFNIPYKYDNFINTPEGKGYSLSCNNDGYDNIIYDKELDTKFNYFNRIIRSVVNNTESKGIAWRTYNALDYKDLPIERGAGKIIEADERAVYIQQEYALFIAIVRDMLSNTPGNDTFLGESDLFDRAPLELLYDKNGYIGSDNRFGAIMTPMGYIVVDTVLKNIFLVKLTQVKKLNDPDIEQWFRDNLTSGLINPYIKQGISLLYDDKIKSIFLTQQGGIIDFTIHYNFTRNGGWLSFHEYIVEGYISNRLATYVISNNKIYKRNANNKGIFLDTTIHESFVIYIYNNQFEVFKQILGISWDTFIKNNGRVVYDSTIDSIMIYNDTQCTGIIDVNDVINWFDTRSGVYKKDQWYLNDIVDKVVDDRLPFVDDNGNIIGNLSNILDWFKESSFLSKYIYIKFGINNTDQRDVVINSYDINATKSIR